MHYCENTVTLEIFDIRDLQVANIEIRCAISSLRSRGIAIGNENQGLGTSIGYRTCTRYSNFEKN